MSGTSQVSREGTGVTDSARAGRRLLLVHAHPDDETIMTGGTIARYLAEGAQVLVVTFTLGEEGEVIGDEWAQLVADGGADQLGGYRIFELTTALAALSPPDRVLRPRFLGGAGHFRDSGMAGSPSAEHPRALAKARLERPVALLADIIAEFAPQVVITYDKAGTYGHPDHVRVHDVTAAALPIARARLGTEMKVYESVTEHSALETGLAAAAGRVPLGWRMPGDGELPRYPDGVITAEVDVSSVYERKAAALAAHATQVTVAASGTEYALSNNILTPIGAVEHFVQVDGPRSDAPGRETDLFAGLD
ncbi:MAG: N-acetyl-1-D-myo-inositol-2-amino-2-deoxy-alpha-D-glucopyranoside deacetylase [Gordonia sp.]|uniref:N-acetyl-1-D-myo-inositol-2-amino-2-deoxy-alpha- D-glucopyranoside deacetylase n=1 Tax=Gordonia sp. (in: high G+C Gram-positive bacteria) TaxID=84139 RepID=UPI001D1DB29C|nr:N-acetyl-1-D-myo-inositol-2-amino-2-deoxy-alpha-D-glucopyranoside deacetylase [Gordonia sp. (in: high G+C Gram-positive bacteria)]MCB1293818.1 N-acetyl-1-D-myo-inositol-2-amino-2-deoxy-alpha-D-glucopyranoside deacetylase [Gordonia sp. (in: high G+C Gram-positive bacteria)]